MTTVKTLAKWAMTAVAPQTATVIMSARARAHSQRLARQWGLIDLNRRLVSHLGAVVQAGPFRGMALTPMTHEEHLHRLSPATSSASSVSAVWPST